MTDPLFDEWRAYQKLLEHDYMYHIAFFSRLKLEIQKQFHGSIALLDLGCGDRGCLCDHAIPWPALCTEKSSLRDKTWGLQILGKNDPQPLALLAPQFEQFLVLLRFAFGKIVCFAGIRFQVKKPELRLVERGFESG